MGIKIKNKPLLLVNIGGLKLKNPVMTASGTFGYGQEYSEFIDLNKLGAIVVKGLSIKPSQGNPPQRIVETPSGMLNSVGLQNIGIPSFIKDKLPFLRQFSTPIIVNFFGDSIEEYIRASEMLSNINGVSALEMNVSCPNKQGGWEIKGTDPNVLANIVCKVRKATHLPLIVKLSPNVTDISLMAKVAQDGGADAVSLVNTFTAMCIDIKTRKPLLANKIGGLSGPAIRPIAIRMVWEVTKVVNIPIIGMGGIMNTKDALEFLIAGATGVAIGSSNFINPQTTIEVIEGIEKFLIEEGIKDIKSLIGSIKV